jgi:hypothetical protein
MLINGGSLFQPCNPDVARLFDFDREALLDIAWVMLPLPWSAALIETDRAGEPFFLSWRKAKPRLRMS